MRLALIADAPWFSRLAAEWSEEERALAAAYASAYGGTLRIVTDTGGVRSLTDDVAGNAAFARDLVESRQLQTAAGSAIGTMALSAGLKRIVDAGLERLAARASAALDADAVTAQAAAGAAALALHRAALAAAASGDSIGPYAHRFTLAEALFSAGRWPLGRIGDGVFVL